MPTPYTIQFGPWSPDLQDVAVQMPTQWGATPIPCADCLNVYYQDGNFRVLPGLASTAPALAAQCLGAMSLYDDVAQEQAVFAGTTGAIYELIDGAWTSIPISAGQQLLNAQMTAGASGANIGFSVAGPYGTLTPAADINNNTVELVNQNTSSSPAFSLTLNGYLYAGYISAVQFPTLGVSLPTSAATFAASGGTLILNSTLTVGYSTSGGNQFFGYGSGFGTLSPATDANGHVIGALYFEQTAGPVYEVVLIINTASLGATYLNILQMPDMGLSLLAANATYSTVGSTSTWKWAATGYPITGTVLTVLIVAGSGTSTWTWTGSSVPLVSGETFNTILWGSSTIAPPASFWSFAAFGQYLAAIPYASQGYSTGPYLWANQGMGNSNFVRPLNSPGCRVGATVGQFLMLGNLLQFNQDVLFTGDASKTSFTGTLSIPMLASGTIADQQGELAGVFANGVVVGNGYLSGGTINYETGALTLTFSTAPSMGNQISARYTQSATYRVQWPAIGDPTNWPIPFTQEAIAFQSSYQDLDPDLGEVMFIAGYPLYAVIFQRFGITRAGYIGGAPVFSFATYERKHGLVCLGGAVQVGPITHFLADDGFWSTDGANVVPIGTATDNSAGIDNWFWANVNTAALARIRSGYDAQKRCAVWAIPTGSNTLPDTLLIYNVLAQKWTRAAVASECVWTTDNGTDGDPATRQTLGVFDQSHVPNTLSGTALTGYLESCDLFFVDGNTRFTSGARAHINCTDTPTMKIGTRNNLQSAVTYSAAASADAFSNLFPFLAQGIYTRARLSSATAQAFHSATLLMEQGGAL